MALPHIKPYFGVLNSKKMGKKYAKAYELYNSQKARSKKSGLPPPAYSAREFISWWVANIIRFKGKTPTVGRLDHRLGYSFDNIEIQAMADNSREGMIRNKTNIRTGIKSGKKVDVYDKKNGNHIATISSVRDAARIFSVSQRLIQFLIRGQYKSSTKINFKLEAR